MKFGLFSFLICVSVLICGSFVRISGQNSAPIVKGVKMGEKFYEMRERASELARIRDELNKPEERNPEPSFPQIKKDFEKLQIVNAEKLQSKSNVNSLNYKLIADASNEINNRAIKLKNNLFPAAKDEKKVISISEKLTGKDFQNMIIAIDNAVYHFVSNPMFQNTKLVKPEDSQSARNELEKIILLSGILKSNAENMK